MPSVHLNTTTSQEVVAAPGAGKRVRVLGFDIGAAGTVAPELRSAATAIWSSNMVAGGQAGHECSDEWQLDCAANEALNLVSAGGVNLRGSLTYCIIPG